MWMHGCVSESSVGPRLDHPLSSALGIRVLRLHMYVSIHAWTGKSSFPSKAQYKITGVLDSVLNKGALA